MAIKLKLDGFDELIRQLEKAGRDADGEGMKCAKECAQILDAELRKQMVETDRDTSGMNRQSSLAQRMPPPQVKNEHGLIKAEVGFKKDTYNPNNPSDAYKAIFLNYGTPRRTKHGKVEGRNFVKKAQKIAKPKMKNAVEKAMDNIVKELKS